MSDDLIDEVNNDCHAEHFGEVFPSFAQQLLSVPRIGEEGPCVRRTPCSCVLQTCSDREEGRYGRLKDEPERERSVNPADQMLPYSSEKFFQGCTFPLRRRIQVSS